jgi:hypothetical protein
METLKLNSKILNYKMTEKNNTCHWCRVSKNRKRKTRINYISCDLCNKIYCQPCINLYPDIEPTNKGCLVCRKLCCCMKTCMKDHKCCFNTRRQSQRNKRIIQTIPIEIVEAIVVDEL